MHNVICTVQIEGFFFIYLLKLDLFTNDFKLPRQIHTHFY